MTIARRRIPLIQSRPVRGLWLRNYASRNFHFLTEPRIRALFGVRIILCTYRSFDKPSPLSNETYKNVYKLMNVENETSCTPLVRTAIQFVIILTGAGRPQWSSSLRHCAKSRKVAVSIPGGVVAIIHPAALWSWGRIGL